MVSKLNIGALVSSLLRVGSASQACSFGAKSDINISSRPTGTLWNQVSDSQFGLRVWPLRQLNFVQSFSSRSR